jgi:hypothetical protein
LEQEIVFMTSFQLTPEQASLLRTAQDHITFAVPGISERFVIIRQDRFDKMKELLEVDEVDPSFFDCEEIDPPSQS